MWYPVCAKLNSLTPAKVICLLFAYCIVITHGTQQIGWQIRLHCQLEGNDKEPACHIRILSDDYKGEQE